MASRPYRTDALLKCVDEVRNNPPRNHFELFTIHVESTTGYYPVMTLKKKKITRVVQLDAPVTLARRTRVQISPKLKILIHKLRSQYSVVDLKT